MTAQPKTAIPIMVLFVGVVSIFADDYVMNPNLATGPARSV